MTILLNVCSGHFWICGQERHQLLNVISGFDTAHMQSDTADSTDLLDLHVPWFILVNIFLETQLVREGFVQACDV